VPAPADAADNGAAADAASAAEAAAAPLAEQAAAPLAEQAEAEQAATAEATASATEPSAAEATTPTEPTTVSEAPAPAAQPVAAMRATEPRSSVAPPSAGDASARSLIPVATGDSDAPQDDVGDYELPGARGVLSGAAIRRVTYVALLAAAAAVPAWVVFRARSVDVQPRAEAAAAAKVTAAGPTTLAPAREIEADDEANEPAEPPPLAVPVDPVKALELRREARRLLEAGQIDPGVAAARNAIALNPADPESYVLLAAGLQDQGRWAESREVFSRCIHKSKDAINAECVYFATSGTITNR